ncbi:MAG: glycosyltransferase family 39 protein [Acidobacteriota bacterium]|nr:glycosyltransferase family 39 protein [Acidobacteriota bacterium]
MSQNPASHAPRRLIYLAVFCLLLFSVVLRVALTLNRELDMDEFQHLHSAWMISRHYLIYRDFWEPHTPLLYYLLLPLFHLFREGAGLVLAARAAVSFTAFGILLMTYALARLGHDRLSALLAVVLLSYMVIFVQKSIEVRPDQLLVIMWLASLWLSARALAGGRGPSWFFLAGLILGVGFLFSPKALMPLGAMSLTFLLLVCLPNPRRSLPRFLKIECAYVCGFLIPVAACLAFFYRAGALREMFEYTLLENFTFPHTYHPTYLLYLRNICFFILAFAGLFIRSRDIRSDSKAERLNHFALLLPSLFLLFVVLFVVAYPFPQVVLLFAPVFAIYGAVALRRSLDVLLAPRRSPDAAQRLRPSAKGALFLAGTVAAGLVVPCVMLLVKERPFTKTNAAQFHRMEYVLGLTRPTDAVFDGEEAYVFRPQAYFYGSLVQGVEWRMRHGEIKDDIPQSLISTQCKVLIYDERVAALPQADQLFINAHYAPSTEPEVYLAR